MKRTFSAKRFPAVSSSVNARVAGARVSAAKGVSTTTCIEVAQSISSFLLASKKHRQVRSRKIRSTVPRRWDVRRTTRQLLTTMTYFTVPGGEEAFRRHLWLDGGGGRGRSEPRRVSRSARPVASARWRSCHDRCHRGHRHSFRTRRVRSRTVTPLAVPQPQRLKGCCPRLKCR